MEIGQMIDILRYNGEDFKAVLQSDGWKIGILRYSERFACCSVLEKHRLTEEAFVLLSGQATLYTEDESGKIHARPMEADTVYNVHRDIWHHITVTPDATVLVVENSNTSRENTDKKEFCTEKCDNGKGDTVC